jgi:polysaccharide export outer membrane protein
MQKIYYLLIVTMLALATSSCRSVKEVAYFQSEDTMSISAMNPVFNYEPTVQPNDVLSVFVSSLSPEASSYFNTFTNAERTGNGDAFTMRSNVGYTIDPMGYIELPLVGKIKLAGLTTSQAKDTLTARLQQYLQYPTVRLYYENFRVIVLGEVFRSGVYNITNEKVTIPEALGLAGDMNIYGDRTNVLLVREDNGVKRYYKIDLTQRDIFSEPYYYLRSNDILYVPPVKGRISQSEDFWRIAPLVLSTITLLTLVFFRFGLADE